MTLAQIAKACLICGVPMSLVALQPDLGTLAHVSAGNRGWTFYSRREAGGADFAWFWLLFWCFRFRGSF